MIEIVIVKTDKFIYTFPQLMILFLFSVDISWYAIHLCNNKHHQQCHR